MSETMKIKTVLNGDIRVQMVATESTMQSLRSVISEAYHLKDFKILALDDEDDKVTLVDNRDLMEVVESAEKNGSVPKFFIETLDKVTKEDEKVDTGVEEEAQEDETAGDENSDEEETEETNIDLAQKLVSDLVENEEFRNEFASFLATFVVTLKESVGTGAEGAFAQALSAHESIYEHETMQKLSPMFPLLVAQFQPMLMFLTALNPEMIPQYLEGFAAMAQNSMNDSMSGIGPMLPPWLHAMCGGATPDMPPPHPHHGRRGGRHGCRGGRRGGRRGRGRHCHQPPPFAGFGFPAMFGAGFPFGAQPPQAPAAEATDGTTPNKKPTEQEWTGLPQGLFDNIMPPAHGRHHHGRHHHGPHHHGPHHGRRGGGRGGKGGCRRFNEGGACGKAARREGWEAEIVGEHEALPALPKQVVIKTWRLVNSGENDWTEGSTVQYKGRNFNPMVNGSEFPVEATGVKDETTVSVVVEAPTESGRYSSNWRLVNAEGRVFGPRLKCDLLVISNEDEEMKQDDNDNDEASPIVSNLMGSDEDIVLVEKSKADKKAMKLEKKAAKLEAKEAKMVAKEAKLADKPVDVKKAAKRAAKEAKLAEQREKLQQRLANLQQELSGISNLPSSSDEDKMAVELEEPVPAIEEAPVAMELEEPMDVEMELDEPVYVYQDALEQLNGMGFEDESLLKEMLDANDGSVEAVLNSLIA